MILNETFALADGVVISKHGTRRINDAAVAQVIRDAAPIGCRHFDTALAQAYENESGFGKALCASGISRDQLFVSTKLVAASKSYADAKNRSYGSLQALALNHIDLMLIHSPQPWTKFREGGDFDVGNLEAWRVLEEVQQAGKLRAIGVSNYKRADLDNILRHGTIKSAVNQVLTHVGNTPFDLIDYCPRQAGLIKAYSPVGHCAVLHHPVLVELAAKHDVGVPRLCVRYCLQLELFPLPESTNADHLRIDAAVDFEIG